jgi:CheY-like chemotaxis protein
MAQKILVVDDDLFIRELYEEIIKKSGYEVDAVMDGVEAVEKIRNNTYSLILLDMNMPNLNGLGVLSELEKNPPLHPNGPIILLTNSGDDAQVKDGLSKGATSYLVKADMDPAQLMENIKKLIGN